MRHKALLESHHDNIFKFQIILSCTALQTTHTSYSFSLSTLLVLSAFGLSFNLGMPLPPLSPLPVSTFFSLTSFIHQRFQTCLFRELDSDVSCILLESGKSLRLYKTRMKVRPKTFPKINLLFDDLRKVYFTFSLHQNEELLWFFIPATRLLAGHKKNPAKDRT